MFAMPDVGDVYCNILVMISVGCVLFDLCYVSGPISYRMQVTQPCLRGPLWRSMWIKVQLARLMSSELGHQLQATSCIKKELSYQRNSAFISCRLYIHFLIIFRLPNVLFAPGSPMMKHICVTYIFVHSSSTNAMSAWCLKSIHMTM